MIDVVTIGEVMASFRSAGRLSVGSSLTLSFAGAEANVAIGLARLGHSSRWCGAVGADVWGRLIVRGLRAEGVDCSRIRTVDDAATGLVVVDEPLAGVRRVDYFRRGSAGSMLSASDAERMWDAPPRRLHISGVTAAISPAAAEAIAVAAARARAEGVPVSLDVNYRSQLWGTDEARTVLRGFVGVVDTLFGSEDELALLASSTDPIDELRDLGVEEVVLKRGAHGATVATDDGVFESEAIAVSVVDPIGAGDAFVTGYLSGSLLGLPPAERLRRGHAVAAFSVANAGDWEGLPTEAELALIGRHDDVVR